MTVQSMAGSTLAISADKPVTFDEAGFAALTYLKIGEITDLGEHGRIYALVTHNPVGSRGTQKYKGSYNSGSKNTGLAVDRDDPGQVLAEAASKSDDDYTYVETDQEGNKEYFLGKVMSFPSGGGSVDAIRATTISIEVTSDKDGNDFLYVPAP